MINHGLPFWISQNLDGKENFVNFDEQFLTVNRGHLADPRLKHSMLTSMQSSSDNMGVEAEKSCDEEMSNTVEFAFVNCSIVNYLSKKSHQIKFRCRYRTDTPLKNKCIKSDSNTQPLAREPCTLTTAPPVTEMTAKITAIKMINFVI